jgi:hypothetical protein
MHCLHEWSFDEYPATRPQHSVDFCHSLMRIADMLEYAGAYESIHAHIGQGKTQYISLNIHLWPSNQIQVQHFYADTLGGRADIHSYTTRRSPFLFTQKHFYTVAAGGRSPRGMRRITPMT